MGARFFVVIAALGLSAAGLSAATLVESFGGSAAGFSNDGYGQSFTTPADGTADWLTGLALLDADGNLFTGHNASAAYIFDVPYGGLIADMPGLLVGGAEGLLGVGTLQPAFDFSFTPLVTALQPDTQYFTYITGAIVALEGIQPIVEGDRLPGENLYNSDGSGNFQSLPDGDLSFRVSADPIPEPGAFALLLAAGGLFLARRRR